MFGANTDKQQKAAYILIFETEVIVYEWIILVEIKPRMGYDRFKSETALKRLDVRIFQEAKTVACFLFDLPRTLDAFKISSCHKKLSCA